MKNFDPAELWLFVREDLLVKDFLMPIRIVSALYLLIGFYIPAGWLFIKATILLILGSFTSYPYQVYASYGTSHLSVLAYWWIQFVVLFIVGYLYLIFIKALNTSGARKMFAVIPIVAFLFLALATVFIIGLIDQYLPGLHIFEAIVAVDQFMK